MFLVTNNKATIEASYFSLFNKKNPIKGPDFIDFERKQNKQKSAVIPFKYYHLQTYGGDFIHHCFMQKSPE